RLVMTFDIYHKVTNDMLLAINVPAQSGFLTDWANIGSLLNKGFEASINFDVLRKKSFLWRVNANYSQNENTVLDLADSDYMLFGNYILQEGKPVGAFYGYVTDGIYKDEDEAAAGPVEVQYLSSGNEPGYRRFVDFNDDGIIDNNDRDIIGYGHPDGFGGISNSIRYKGFKLDVFLIYSHGNLIYNATRQKLEDMFGSKGTRNRYSTVTDRWRPPNSYYYGDPGNPEGVLPGITYDETIFHDDYLESGNYLKLKSVNLSYDLPQTYAKMILMKNLRFRINLTNLYTFSDYLGYDPEINMGKNKGLMPSTDNAGAPPSLIVSFGITGKF
ncbi:MAG: hypothetical protein KAS71_15285, partial [Bacteroidales bacterium]|nr:hypothetical protein [Bacteroidales bacterium]